MASNDTLDLIFDDPDVVHWQRASEMIAALELAHGEVLAALQDLLFPRPDRLPAARNAPAAFLAASPRPGSLILPLVFDALGQKAASLATLFATSAAGPAALRQTLSLAADTGGLVMFVHWVLFGADGLVAKVTGQPTRDPEPAERPAAEVADLFFENGGVDWVENLMAAAEKTGCARVRVRLRDIEVDLVMKDRKTSSSRLGRRRGSQEPSDNPIRFTRAGKENVSVIYKGKARTAFLARQPDNQGFLIVLGRPDKDMDLLPEESGMPITVEARGKYVDQQDVQAKDDIPDGWRNASGIFLIEGIRRADFY